MVSICLLLGTIPVALFSLAYLFVEQLEWSQALALAIAALVGLALAAIVGGTAWAIVRAGLVSLERSREEFSRNIDWLKTALRNRAQFPAAEKPLS
jgi:hypothetical protein